MPKQLENWEKEFIRNWIAIKDFSQDDMLKYIRDQRQEAAKEIQERDRKSLEARNQPKEIKEKIIEILKAVIPDNPSYEPNYDYYADRILALLEAENRKWVEKLKRGEICHNCGAKKEQNLSDWCDRCLEEN